MQSLQESVLEEFMQRSFGAQFLFIPQKYRKGTSQREPADLAWTVEDFVILFYLRSSVEPLSAQIEHNRRQAAGYYRLWSTEKTAYKLCGKNRFGDECSIDFKKVKNYLCILVVSERCGIHFAPPLTSSMANAVLVIPDLFVHWVASFGGTIVDLLGIIDIYLDRTIGMDTTVESAFSMLKILVDKYVNDSVLKADPDRKYLSGTVHKDYMFLWNYLAQMRVPATFGGAIQDVKGREQIASLFGDLMLLEYASLAAGAETAIQVSEPPMFKKWVVIKIDGLYYSFVVGTVHMGSNNTVEVTKSGIEACRNGAGEMESIYIQYGNVMNANEYRCPLMFVIPEKLPRKHSIALAEKIINKGQV
jgi:hypothetical protein